MASPESPPDENLRNADRSRITLVLVDCFGPIIRPFAILFGLFWILYAGFATILMIRIVGSQGFDAFAEMLGITLLYWANGIVWLLNAKLILIRKANWALWFSITGIILTWIGFWYLSF